MDWYCSGPYAEVSDLIRSVLRKAGFIPDACPMICEIDDCLNEGTSYSKGEDGVYRTTCFKHSAFGRS